MNISLSLSAMERAAMIGVKRRLNAKFIGKVDTIQSPNRKVWDIDIEAAAAEYAVAIALGIKWQPSVKYNPSEPDIAPSIEVKHTSVDLPTQHLIIQKHNPIHHDYVFVLGRDERYRIAGWISGQRAMQDRWLRSNTNFGESFFVPQKELRSIDLLIEILSNGKR